MNFKVIQKFQVWFQKEINSSVCLEMDFQNKGQTKKIMVILIKSISYIATKHCLYILINSKRMVKYSSPSISYLEINITLNSTKNITLNLKRPIWLEYDTPSWRCSFWEECCELSLTPTSKLFETFVIAAIW